MSLMFITKNKLQLWVCATFVICTFKFKNTIFNHLICRPQPLRLSPMNHSFHLHLFLKVVAIRDDEKIHIIALRILT